MKLKTTTLKRVFLFAFFMFFAFCGYAGSLTANVTSSTGGALPGAKIKIFKGPNYVGEFNPGPDITGLGVGSYTIYAHYVGTSSKRETVNITSATANDPVTLNFKTTNVKFHFSGDFLNFYTSGSWSSFGKTNGEWNARELFENDYSGNPMQIQAAHVWNDRREVIFPLVYNKYTINVEKTIAVIRVLNSSNNPIAGATVRGLLPYVYFVPGATNANGLLLDLTNGNQTSLSYEAKVNNTIAVVGPQNPNTNSYFLFKTNLLELKLAKCNGDGLSGGTVRYGAGANFSTYYFPAPNSTGVNGITSAEFFPGTYSFEMNYQSTAQVKTSVIIPNSNTTLTWNTTNVTLNWQYDIAYGGGGDNRYFNKPSMELLPGTVNFNFRSPGSNNYVPLTISGCSMTLSPGIVRLRSSTNTGIAGGLVEGYDNGWTTYGSTDANGNLFVLDKNPSYLRMSLNGASQQTGIINFAVNSPVTFQTKKVTVDFKNSLNAPLASTADQLEFYSDGWRQFGAGETDANGEAFMELLPVAYWFRLGYAGASQQTSQLDVNSLPLNVNNNPLVIFQTKKVAVNFKNSLNAPLSSTADQLEYYIDGWRQFGAGETDANGEAFMELLPVAYWFRLGYAGASQQTSQLDVNSLPLDVSNNPLVTFQTVNANLQLLNGASPVSGGIATYYVGSFLPFGDLNNTTDVNGNVFMELLPVPYYFAIDYNGTYLQQGQITPVTNSPIVFQLNGGSRIGAQTPAQPKDMSAIYPNPATDKVNVTLPSGAEYASVKISTLDGRQVMDRKLNLNNSSVNVSDLPGGIYQLMLNVDGKLQVHRMVITK